jgi:hypothetical protein
MSEKPQKRLVSKSEYARVQARRVSAWYGVTLCFGMTLCTLAYVPWRWNYRIAHHSFSWNTCIAGVVLLGMAAAMYYLGRWQLSLARAIEPVAYITRANTGDLPASESLVRASHEPQRHQQAELLRAAQHSNETPAEELLRATKNSKSD